MSSSSTGPSRTEALETLQNLSDFLAASVVTLSSSKTAAAAATHTNASYEPSKGSASATLAVILADLRGLLTLLSKETTSLSLAFAPPKEHWDAVDGAAKKLHELASKLLYGLGLLRQQHLSRPQQDHSREPLIAKQWRIGILTVLECTKELAESSVKIYKTSGDKPIKSAQRSQILANTSLIWKAVERSQSLPTNERDAFLAAWTSMLETFEDALEEVQELTKREAKGKGRAEDQDEDDQEISNRLDDSDEDLDDDFDFDNMDDDGPISERELEVARVTYRYMKLVKALLRKISTFSHESMPYDLLYEQGERIASTHDEVASALQPQQSDSDTAREFEGYTAAVNALLESVLQSQPQDSMDSVANEVARLDLTPARSREASAISVNEVNHKWLQTCRTQLNIASENIHSLLTLQ